MVDEYAAQMADLVLRLFELCQERQMYFAAQYGIRVAEFRCLRMLLKKDHVPVKELASGMHLTPGRLTRIVDELKKRGMVDRVEPETDRRMKIISLTKDGRKLAQQMEEDYLKMHGQILSYLEEKNLDPYIELLQKLLVAMEKWSADHLGKKHGSVAHR